MLEAAGVGGAGDSEVLASRSSLQVPVWEPEAEQGEKTWLLWILAQDPSEFLKKVSVP